MRTALDANILSAILTGEPQTAILIAELRQCRQEGELLISPVVYAELLAHPHATESFLNQFLADGGVRIDFRMDRGIWTEAGRRFAGYAARRRLGAAGGPRRILTDFIIGAHALVHADRLMSVDTKVYKQDFPDLALYPTKAH